MRKRNLPINKTAQKIKRERAPMPWRYFTMTILCGLFLVVGFFFAARQHFSAIDYGIKNSRLRKQIDELETEKRQLMLSREIALSPAEIKKAAKKIGLSAMTASNIEAFRSGGATPEQPKAEKISTMKTETKPAANSVAAQTPLKKAPEKEAKTDKALKSEKRTEKKPEKKSGDVRERMANVAR